MSVQIFLNVGSLQILSGWPVHAPRSVGTVVASPPGPQGGGRGRAPVRGVATFSAAPPRVYPGGIPHPPSPRAPCPTCRVPWATVGFFVAVLLSSTRGAALRQRHGHDLSSRTNSVLSICFSFIPATRPPSSPPPLPEGSGGVRAAPLSSARRIPSRRRAPWARPPSSSPRSKSRRRPP